MFSIGAISFFNHIRIGKIDFIKEIINYREGYDRYLELIKKGKNEKLASIFKAYFKKVGGDVFTAYLSLALAILTIKGEVKEEDQKLIEKIYG